MQNRLNLVKSPLNYVGGKFKLLPQIFPIFPSKINTFVDLFCGGGNVGLNVLADKIVLNDNEKAVMSFLSSISEISSKDAVQLLESIIKKYSLSKTNEEGYMQLRKDYNEGNKSWNMFYALVAHSFNNQIRFNSNEEFNMPFGKNRSSFNENLKSNFVRFVDRLRDLHSIEFTSYDFKDIYTNAVKGKDLIYLDQDSFVYCDPPYILADAVYNEGGKWTQTDEQNLYDYLDMLSDRKIKFALSNVFETKGIKHKSLIKWSSNYNVHYLKSDYSNCNYHRKDKGNTVEVLITNY